MEATTEAAPASPVESTPEPEPEVPAAALPPPPSDAPPEPAAATPAPEEELVTPAPSARGDSWFLGTNSPAPEREVDDLGVVQRKQLPTWVPAAVVLGAGGLFVFVLVIWLALT
ncbi:MAG: hypothetical protein H6735_33095 [Alphaproteobacteria bacterium]|nr:hypothetical protein [Alphaproteobacteria bacterium]